jgi:hypothetical protein
LKEEKKLKEENKPKEIKSKKYRERAYSYSDEHEREYLPPKE